MVPQKKIQDVFNRYLNNECSSEEIELLLQYFDAEENEKLLKDLIRKELNTTDTNNNIVSSETQSKLTEIFNLIKKKR